LSYVQRSNGEITAEPPVKVTDVSFDWPVVSVSGGTDIQRPPASVMLAGALRLSAHDGLLDVRLRSLILNRVGQELELTIEAGSGRRISLVRGRYNRTAAVSGAQAWVVPEPRLMSEAEHIFGGQYEEGLPFDPLLLVLTPSGTTISRK
jgi:hypothetical protein